MDLFKTFRNTLLVAMKDPSGMAKLARIVTPDEARVLNKQQFGLFFTVQGFKEQRKKEYLRNLNAWAIDIDEGSKEEQLTRILQTPLKPSLVVETKNGYHVYWYAKEASLEWYPIIMNQLIKKFRADNRAKDICRLLRVPNSLHWKNPEEPFRIKIVYESEAQYEDREMIFFFADQIKKKDEERRVVPDTKELLPDVEPKVLLKQLSGSSFVNGDKIEFVPNSDGTEQIWINGKSTSSWIDKKGLIGSHDNGGPYVWQWLKWYGYTNKDVYGILKDLK